MKHFQLFFREYGKFWTIYERCENICSSKFPKRVNVPSLCSRESKPLSFGKAFGRRGRFISPFHLTLPSTLMVHSKRDLLYRNTGRHAKKSIKSWKRIKIQGLTFRPNFLIYKSKPVKHFQLYFGEYGKFKLSTRDLKIFALASFQSLSMYRICTQENQTTV